MASHQKLGIISENQTSQNLKLSKNAFYKKCGPKLIFLNKKKQKNSAEFWHRKIDSIQNTIISSLKEIIVF